MTDKTGPMTSAAAISKATSLETISLVEAFPRSAMMKGRPRAVNSKNSAA
jgi:hypothetical protein